jgi:hypothetical protein
MELFQKETEKQQEIVQEAIAKGKDELIKYYIDNPRTITIQKMIEIVEGWLKKQKIFPKEFDISVALEFLNNLKKALPIVEKDFSMEHLFKV